MSWPLGVLIAIDQLGNAIAGGNPDATISARVGFFAIHSRGIKRYYWLLLQAIIDFTFYPVDGPRHCYQAMLDDKDEGFKEGSDVMRVILGEIIILACIPISIVLRLAVLLIPGWRFTASSG
jgi:hypothetical protein